MENNNEEPYNEDDQSNSNSGVILHAPGDLDGPIEISITTDTTITTSDLLNVTPVCYRLIEKFHSIFFNYSSYVIV